MSASYPTSTKSFTTKVDGPGHTISASHVNDLQDEVVAIENGLRAGLQHTLLFTPDATYDLGASGATRPRDGFFGRNVAIAGTAAITGILTTLADVVVAATKKLFLDGGGDTYLIESAANTVDLYTNGVKALTVDATQFIDSATQPRARAYKSSGAQAIADSSATAVTLDAETFDVGALHDTGSNTSRLTVPTGGDGLYLLIGSVSFAANATGVRALTLKKNATTALADVQQVAANVTQIVPIMCLAVLAAADYVEVYATQTSGGNLNANTGESTTFLSAVKLW